MAPRRYRRVVRRRRIPLRRAGAYRIRRRPFRRIRRIPKVHRFKFTRQVSITQDLAVTSKYNLQFRPGDFAEWKALSPNFEAFRFTRLRVRVLPQQNISNNSTSLIGDYCLLPWHEEIDSKASFQDYLSVDKAKLYRGTACGRMTFVPNVLQPSAYQTAGNNWVASTPKFKARIETSSTEFTGDIWHYTGLMAMQALTDAPANSKAHYNVIMDAYCTFYNQKTVLS